MKKSKEEFKGFVILPQLNYVLRIIITLFLIITAVFIQFYFDKIIPGFIVLFLASIINIIRDIKYKVDFSEKKDWKEVTEEEYRKFIKRMENIKKLKGHSFSEKFTIIFSIIFIIILSTPIIDFFILNRELTTLVIDSLILFLPIFLSGNRSFKIDREEDTFIKVKNLLYAMNILEVKTKKFDLVPYFEISEVKNKGKIPVDAKVMVKAKDSPPELLGIQFQVNINRVQSKKYPYFYAVIIARKDFGLFKKAEKIFKKAKKNVIDNNIKFEFSKQEEVDVIVIRQETTQETGYYTDKKIIEKIVLISLFFFVFLYSP